VIDDNKHIYPKFHIYLLVPDKNTVLEKVKNANKSSNHITKYMTEQNILDKNDLNKCFLCFKADILKHMKAGNIDYDEIYLSSKSNLSLRFHQELITKKHRNLSKKAKRPFYGDANVEAAKPIWLVV